MQTKSKVIAQFKSDPVFKIDETFNSQALILIIRAHWEPNYKFILHYFILEVKKKKDHYKNSSSSFKE